MDRLHTHITTADRFITPPDPAADSFITPPDPALECEIVTTWFHYQVKGTRPHHGSPVTRVVTGLSQ